jgi:hypothetical protein
MRSSHYNSAREACFQTPLQILFRRRSTVQTILGPYCDLLWPFCVFLSGGRENGSVLAPWSPLFRVFSLPVCPAPVRAPRCAGSLAALAETARVRP